MLNISLKNIRKLPVAAALCVALLAACGGGGGGATGVTVSADQAAFNAVLVRYDAASAAADPAVAYAAAITDFTTFKSDYSTSGRVDDADYYIARSKHELALLPVPVDAVNNLAAALATYTTLAASTSNKADNAQFYIGKMRYDENTQAGYTAAITEFDKVLAYTSPSAGDDAQYYIGRSKHELALLTSAYTLAQAQAEYTMLLNTYAVSTRRDDAQYQIGKTHFDALTPSIANYDSAIAAFDLVFTNYTTAASSADDAQYFKARATHEKALLQPVALDITNGLNAARTEYDVVLSATYPLSNRRDDAQYQIGKTHFDAGDDAAAITEFSKVLNTALFTAPSVGDDAQYFKARSTHNLANNTAGFGAARTEYAKVNITAYPRSNRLDDAEYYSAFTYHDSTQCNAEQTAMTAFVNKYTAITSPVFRPLAQVEIADISVANPSGTANHKTCIQ